MAVGDVIGDRRAVVVELDAGHDAFAVSAACCGLQTRGAGISWHLRPSVRRPLAVALDHEVIAVDQGRAERDLLDAVEGQVRCRSASCE
jgi:hypothetical protein